MTYEDALKKVTAILSDDVPGIYTLGAYGDDVAIALYERLELLTIQRDELLDFAYEIVKWSEAYPASVFPEPTPEKIDEVCKMSGFMIDAISAMVLRYFTKPWGDKAKMYIKKCIPEND